MRENPARPGGNLPAPPMDQFNYCLTEVCDQLMHLVIMFGARLDEQRLRRAFRESLGHVPVFASRFVEAEKPFWEPVPDLDPDRYFRVHTATSPQDALVAAMIVPIDPAAGPQVRLDLIRSGTDTLCITVHHATTDARGLEVYAAMLASLYRGSLPHGCNPHTGRGDPTSGMENPDRGMENPDRSLHPLLGQFSIEARSEAAASPLNHTNAWAFPHESLGCSTRSFAVRPLPSGSAGVVRRYAKNRGATVNDALLGAVFLALCEYNAPEPGTPLPLLHSVDLRRHPPAGTPGIPETGDTGSPDGCSSCGTSAIRNYSIALELTLISGAPCLDALLPEIVAITQYLKAGNIGLASAVEIESLETVGFAAVRDRIAAMQETYRVTGCKTPFFANIGIIPEESADFGPDCPARNTYLAGMVGYPPGIILAASTFRDRITFSMGYCVDAIPPVIAEGFLDAVARYLPGVYVQ